MEDFYMVKVIGLYKNSEKSATLNKVHLKAYWADEDGNKIDKGYFGSTIRLYIEEYWAYNVLLKIFLKQEDTEEVICLDMLRNIIPAYFLQQQNYLEVCLKQSYDYKILSSKKEIKLCCGISNGFGYFQETPIIASIPITNNIPWMDVAIGELGVQEIRGKKHNERIIEYHSTTNLNFDKDEIPWCSSFVNWCLYQVGIVGTNNALAYSWLHYGMELNKPAYGAIAIMNYSHVGFVAGINDDHRIILLGGNQGDAVTLSPNSSKLVKSYRYPIGLTPDYNLPKYRLYIHTILR